MADGNFLSLDKISISGATLASLLHLSATSSGDSSGLITGHLFHHLSPTPPLSDYDHQPPPSPSLSLSITDFIFSNSPISFFNSLGHVNTHFPSLSASSSSPLSSVIGWFSFRRRSAFRPSMRELAVSASLAKALPTNTPLVFLLLSSSVSPNRSIHTHEYSAFVLRSNPNSVPSLEPRSIAVRNLPEFSYGSFSPECLALPFFPIRKLDESNRVESIGSTREKAKEQKVLDFVTDGFGIDRLGKMVESRSVYTKEMEDLYGNILGKLESLAQEVEKNFARVIEQENHNLQLRCKLAGLESS